MAAHTPKGALISVSRVFIARGVRRRQVRSLDGMPDGSRVRRFEAVTRSIRRVIFIR
jgi:hypothetical protein